MTFRWAPHELSLKRRKSNTAILYVVHKSEKVVFARIDWFWLRHTDFTSAPLLSVEKMMASAQRSLLEKQGGISREQPQQIRL